MLDKDKFNDRKIRVIPNQSYMKKEELWELHSEVPEQIIFLVSLSSKWRTLILGC